jgi:hypothetical protein
VLLSIAIALFGIFTLIILIMVIRGLLVGDAMHHFKEEEKEIFDMMAAPDYKETAAPMDPKSVHDRMKRTEKKINKR